MLGVSLLRISLPVFVAVNRNLLAARGLDVELRTFDTAQPMADELAAGRIDAGGYVAFPILFGAGRTPPLRVFTAIVEDAHLSLAAAGRHRHAHAFDAIVVDRPQALVEGFEILDRRTLAE